MNDKFLTTLGMLFTVAAGVAIIALLASKSSATSGVIQSFFSGSSNLLASVSAPITGASISITNAYPTTTSDGNPNL